MSDLPWTPDFESYSTQPPITQAFSRSSYVHVIWADDKESQFDVYLLRENSPDPDTVHPKSREMLISPLDLPSDLKAISADVEANGALVVGWSTGESSRFHPGWLRKHAWFQNSGVQRGLPPVTAQVNWDRQTIDEPPTFCGPAVLEDEKCLLTWLEALNVYGVARLRGLPDQDGLLERLVRNIGSPRESNFGAQYTLTIKDEPDSNAFTSGALLQHMDMPTRECPHGLQFLFCRRNTVTGGEGVYVDGFRVAKELQINDPDMFKTLTDTSWVFNNRSRDSDYRAEGPVIGLDERGELKEIRLTSWLRAPLMAPLSIQQAAYRAIRVLTGYLQDEKFQLSCQYKSGDLLAFDNRRVLHGRRAYDSSKGERLIDGIYADRDDLYSRIRVLRRKHSIYS